MAGGRLFQTRRPATANALSPSHVVVRGMSSIILAADREPGRPRPARHHYRGNSSITAILIPVSMFSNNTCRQPHNNTLLGMTPKTTAFPLNFQNVLQWLYRKILHEHLRCDNCDFRWFLVNSITSGIYTHTRKHFQFKNNKIKLINIQSK